MGAERQGRLPVSVSVAVYIQDNEQRLLFVQQSEAPDKGKWGPPAGGMEAHENPQQAAEREVREEIGAGVRLTGLIGIYTADRGDDASGLGLAFTGTLEDQELTLQEGEISGARYFTNEEITALRKEGLIYKPEYTEPVLDDLSRGQIFPAEVIK